jgi:hypothetical protein
MDTELILICALTGVINLIGALAYAARIAGVRTGRIALSFALFNILLLVSRTSNGFLGPFLAKRIETGLANGAGDAFAFRIATSVSAIRHLPFRGSPLERYPHAWGYRSGLWRIPPNHTPTKLRLGMNVNGRKRPQDR